jgi:methylated-DNA-[protein]-cysteine S-methyltransferase
VGRIFYTHIESPLGPLLLAGDRRGLKSIEFPAGKAGKGHESGWERSDEDFAVVATQLREYFAGERRVFDIPLNLSGTPFQLAVWEKVREIPYGKTVSYADIALAIGRPRAVRAVGAANRQNPVPIVIPCHRVIGKDGSLTGYGGGLECKATLLRIEGVVIGVRPARHCTPGPEGTPDRLRGRLLG